VDEEFLLTHGRHNSYFKLHIHGRVNFIEGRGRHRLCTPDIDAQTGMWDSTSNVANLFILPTLLKKLFF